MSNAPWLFGIAPPIVISDDTYTVRASDCGRLLLFTFMGNVNVTLPEAVDDFGAGFAFDIQNHGNGIVTVNPVTSMIDDQLFVDLIAGQGGRIWSSLGQYRSQGASMSSGGTATTVGPLGGDLYGTLPNPEIARGAVTAVKQAALLTNASNSVTIPPGTPVYVTATGKVAPARADTIDTANVLGIACYGLSPAGTGHVAASGLQELTIAQWNVITGQSNGLTPGARYYLSDSSSGKLTSTMPTMASSLIVPIGIALSTTLLFIVVGTAIQL